MEEMRNKLRKQMMSERNKLFASQVEEFSKRIALKLQELEGIESARSIMGFSSIKNEVNLMPFLEEIKGEKTILLPRVEEDGSMVAIEYRGKEYMKSGYSGIMEPVGEPYDIKQIDAVLVPGLVFDYQGYRLGYGKGFYDRFLASLRPDAFICGVCYEFQIVENCYPHEADIPVQWIVTDKSELVIEWEHF